MLRKLIHIGSVLMLTAMFVNLTTAQPEPPPRPDRNTPEPRLRGSEEPPAGIDTESPTRQQKEFTLPETLAMPEITFDLPEDWQSFQMPSDWATFTLPEGLPTDSTELADFLQDYELPYEFSSDTLLADSSEEASGVIVGFGSQYLGTTVMPLYAGTFPAQDSEVDASYTSIESTLPPEYQVMLDMAKSISGVGYWAILDSGVAVIYTGDCPPDAACSFTLDSLQFTISDGSLGMYSAYLQGSVASQEAALQAATVAYPMLAAIQLTPVEADSGYTFTGMLSSIEAQQLIGYAVNVVNVNDQTIVTASVGIGNAYIEIMR